MEILPWLSIKELTGTSSDPPSTIMDLPAEVT